MSLAHSHPPKCDWYHRNSIGKPGVGELGKVSPNNCDSDRVWPTTGNSDMAAETGNNYISADCAWEIASKFRVFYDKIVIFDHDELIYSVGKSLRQQNNGQCTTQQVHCIPGASHRRNCLDALSSNSPWSKTQDSSLEFHPICSVMFSELYNIGHIRISAASVVITTTAVCHIYFI